MTSLNRNYLYCILSLMTSLSRKYCIICLMASLTALTQTIMTYPLQRLVCGVLNTNMKEWSLKEVAVMVNMIATLAAQLEGGTDEVSTEACVVHGFEVT